MAYDYWPAHELPDAALNSMGFAPFWCLWGLFGLSAASALFFSGFKGSVSVRPPILGLLALLLLLPWRCATRPPFLTKNGNYSRYRPMCLLQVKLLPMRRCNRL